MRASIFNYLSAILHCEKLRLDGYPITEFYPERGCEFLICTMTDTYFHAVNRKYPMRIAGKRVIILRFRRLNYAVKNILGVTCTRESIKLLMKSKYYLGTKRNCKFYSTRNQRPHKSEVFVGHVFDIDMIESELLSMSAPLNGKPTYKITG
ncbi:MAG TPA: hypothetical protein VF679_01635 [Pedobacter sp.]